MNIDISVFFEKSVQKIQFSLKSDKNNGYFYVKSIISCSFLLGMRNVTDKSCRGNQIKNFGFSIFFPENLTV